MSAALLEIDVSNYVQEVKNLEIFRAVESQEKVATAGLVDTADEQLLLEQLLEASKPFSQHLCDGWHYLIATPFRYPPLPYGSRFGTVVEPSLFYGAYDSETAFAEVAYYAHKFLYEDMAEPPQDVVKLDYTLFSVGMSSQSFLALDQDPFLAFKGQLRDPKEHTHSQALGAQMRSAGVECFSFFSARSEGVNVGVFDIVALNKTPKTMVQWRSFCSSERFEVVRADLKQKLAFVA